MKIANDSRHGRFIARVLFYLVSPLLCQAPAFAAELYLKDSDLSEARATLIRRSYSQCADRAGSIHPEMMGCIYIELEYQDSRLNQMYRRLRKTLPREQWFRLRSEQRQWLAGLQRHCKAGIHEDITGGQAEQLLLGSCTLIETAARAKVLEDLLEANAGSPE